MNFQELINHHYTKESAVKILTSYILYYQISLSEYVFETIQDPEETILKLKELNLSVDPNRIFIEITPILIKNTSKKLDHYIREVALRSSLMDFTNKDQELLNKQSFISQKLMEIEKDIFFNSKMKIQFLSQYDKMIKHYEKIINDEYMESVREIIYTNYADMDKQIV